jgi:hypothetical protein
LGDTAPNGPQLQESSIPSFSCIQFWSGSGEANSDAGPLFIEAENGDCRLQPQWPCIDAGDNTSPQLPETNISGMHRIMFGGKSPTVDMGSYEHCINVLEVGQGPEETTLTWSSLPATTYSILYSEDLLTWHLADDNVLSAGFETTFWTDDGSKTGVPPSVVTRRFYRLLENP